MKVIPKLDHISDNFITDYLTALGVEDIKHFLKPIKKNFEDYWKYPHIREAIEQVNYHINSNTNIGIIVDSDTDGACSSALIYNFLIYLGVDKDRIILYFHEGKQHGLKDLIDQIIATNGEQSLLIIPDAGSNDTKECQVLYDKAIDVVILDHHNIEELNPFAIIVNNQWFGVDNKFLSGTGVTDKFVRAYCEKYKVKYPDYSDLVAVSLVSDVCDLSTLENRTYMYFGLHNITNPFLKFLFEKLCQRRGYNADGIGWNISPLANALARSNEQESKTLFFDGLIGKISPEQALKEIRRIKRLQDEEVKAVVTEIEPNLDLNTKVIVGFTQPDKANFTGLIANKFTGKYNKPTILLRDTNYGSWSGSLRSPVPLATKINENGIAHAQGHEEACGIIVKKNKLKKFIEWLEELDLSSRPETPVTVCGKPEDITIKLCQAISDNKELWGHGIKSPTIYINTICTQENVFVFEKSSTTLKVDLDGVGCLKFFAKPEEVQDFKRYDKFNLELIVGDFSVNEYEGYKSPQCMIQEYEITPIVEKVANWEDEF